MSLTRRERAFIGVGVGIAVLGLVYRFWIGPLYERKAQLTAQVTRLQELEKKVYLYLVQYRQLERKEKEFERLAFSDSLPGSLLRAFESAMRELKLKRHLLFAKPSQSLINERFLESFLRVKLSGLRWKDLIRLLHKLESGNKGIWVKKARLIVKEEKGGGKELDSEISLSTFQRRNGAEREKKKSN